MVKKSYKPQAIITGAGSGIGRATAKRFYEAGYSVCCIDINQEELKKTLHKIDNKGIAINLDISKAKEVKKGSKKIERLFNNSSVIFFDKKICVKLPLLYFIKLSIVKLSII